MLLAVVLLIFLVNSTPNQIPADLGLERQKLQCQNKVDTFVVEGEILGQKLDSITRIGRYRQLEGLLTHHVIHHNLRLWKR